MAVLLKTELITFSNNCKHDRKPEALKWLQMAVFGGGGGEMLFSFSVLLFQSSYHKSLKKSNQATLFKQIEGMESSRRDGQIDKCMAPNHPHVSLDKKI